MDLAPKILKSFCTSREAAQILGVSVRTAQLWTEEGLLEAWKTGGGHRRISRQSVLALLASPQLSQSPVQEEPADSAGNALTILVVEDEPSILQLYELRIARWQMKAVVITARNGIDALVRIGMTRPDLLVTDLLMPDMDGFQMLAHLRTMPELAEMTTVVVSGLDPEDIAAKGGIPTGIPVLPKPVPFDRLRDIATVVADRKRRAGAEVPV